MIGDFCISGGWLQLVNSAYKCTCRMLFDLMSPPATLAFIFQLEI